MRSQHEVRFSLQPRLEVVKDTNGSVTARDESFNEMTPDESGAAGDEDFGRGVGFQEQVSVGCWEE
jgi:hypothetical protein